MIKKVKSFLYYLFHDPTEVVFMAWEKFAAPLTTDKFFLKVKFRLKMGYWMDFDNPKTFSEKIQWLKLNDIHPEYTQMVDKVAAKDYVRSKVGDKYIIPTLGVWDNVDDIDWDSLPNKFVVKATNDSGGVVVCRDKSKLNIEEAKSKLRGLGGRDYTKTSKEYPYHGVPHRFIAEELLENGVDADLPDYKFFCFNGEPMYCQVIRDRNSKETIDFYDMDWIHQEFVGLSPFARNGLTPVARPGNLEEMKDVCRKLAKDIRFVRVDLYVIDDMEYFGELTFFPASGLGVFRPEHWNEKLGNLLTLPTTNGGGYNIVCDNNLKIYKGINPRHDIRDYKIFCFNGEARFFKIDFGRQVEHHANYYDCLGNLLPFGELSYPPIPEMNVKMPHNLHEMILIAEKLSKGIPFLRVDLYNVNGGTIFFGELTFFPISGMGKYTSFEWDKRMGDYLKLPKTRKYG